MQQIRRGDDSAFAVLYDRHSSAAYSLAYRMTGASGLAQDVVQEALLSLWRSHTRYDHRRGSTRTWLLGIVHNRAIDALRRHSVHSTRRAGDEGLEARFEAPRHTETEVVRHEEAREVRRALDALPAEQSRVIELAYFGGFTHTEIAGMLDAPVGTVKGRMRLGLEKLRAELANPIGATA